MWLIHPLLVKRTHFSRHYSYVFRLVGIDWYLFSAVFRDKFFKLLASKLFKLNCLFSFTVKAVVSIQLFLQRDYLLISFVESTCQSNHNVTILHQNVLISVNLLFVLFDLLTFPFYFCEFNLIFLSYKTLLMFKCCTELRSIFDFTPAYQHLRVHSFDFLL